ncbi:MAG: hypothetical protein Q4C56_10070 [Peptococcaceae bacterium]|nr:hypothetical protein [Peptococcaceae bacterium]
MNDREISCASPQAMVEEAHQTIYESLGKLKYVNMKFKTRGNRESGWLYNVDFSHDGENMIITFPNSDQEAQHIALNNLEYLKLRPYYKAACIGFKNIVFYSDVEKGASNEP